MQNTNLFVACLAARLGVWVRYEVGRVGGMRGDPASTGPSIRTWGTRIWGGGEGMGCATSRVAVRA